MSPRPRIAFTAGDLSARELERLLVAREPGEREVDLVLCGRALPDVPSIEAGEELGPRLEAALRDGRAVAGLRSEDGLAAAVELARAGKVDALAGAVARPEELPALAKLLALAPDALRIALVRGPRIVLVASGAAPGPQPGLDADRALATLEIAARGLARDLGIARPRIAVCARDPEAEERGSPGLARACAQARARGLDVRDPVAAEDALQAPDTDAVLVLTRDQARLGLALPPGSGPTARLVLGGPFPRASEDPGAPREAREGSLRASIVLAARAARARGELVQAREQKAADSLRAVVAVSARRGVEDRCPYCRRPFDEDEPGLPCARCETLHHRACFHEHGRCTIHGCGGTTVRWLGRELEAARLGGASTPTRHAFVATLGPEPAGPDALRSLRVHAPVDLPDERSAVRDVSLEVGDASVARGSVLEGALVVRSPAPFRASRGVLRVRATLETRDSGADARARVQPILEREVLVLGREASGVFGRLSDGLAALLDSEDLPLVPAGTRLYPFACRLGSDHPASVEHAGPRGSEVVATVLEARLFVPGGPALVASRAITVT